MDGLISASTSAEIAGRTAPAKVKSKGKIARRLGYGVLALGVVLFAAHLLWTFSGSNTWQLDLDKDGVKVWTLKSPGTALLRVRSESRVKSSLAGMVKLLEDLDSCADAYCYDTKVIRLIDSKPGNYGKYVRFKFDIPGFTTRDYVLFAEHIQDPKTKQIEINIMAAPDMLPWDPCCVRVTHLHNSWVLTPLKNGEIDILFTQDTDLGGMFYPLANAALKWGMFKVQKDMQGLMNKDRYKSAQVDYIQELDATAPAL